MKKINILLLLMMAIRLLSSCSNDEIVHSVSDGQEWHTATMVMNVTKISFDLTTKAADGWSNGDVVYLIFTKGSSKVQGKAVYNVAESSWTVSYDGNLSGTSESAVSIWYFEDAGSENSGALALTSSTGIYVDEFGKYTYPSDGDLVVIGNLKPKTGRIQFKGETALSIEVGGISHYTSFNMSTGELSALDSSVTLQVQTDGYTPYLYGEFTETTNRTIKLTHSYYIFTTECPNNVLQIGKSGYMSIPTVESHNEWVCEEDQIKGHEYVDLSLPSGALWATMNIGASSPEECGDYFAWGETKGYNEGKSNFSWETYKWSNGTDGYVTKYCTDDLHGIIDNVVELELSDDAAHVIWGGKWTIPTREQFAELKDECEITMCIQNNIRGCKMTSKHNGKSIFFPAYGQRYGYELDDYTCAGIYWSCSLYQFSSDDAENLIFYYENGSIGVGGGARFVGHNIRPILQNN